jgi:uncharacterized RDD family membrane protein YckC
MTTGLSNSAVSQEEENGLIKRYIVFTIDFLAIGTLLGVLNELLHGALFEAYPLIGFVLYVSCLALMPYWWGSTLGQRLFKLRTVNRRTRERPGLVKLFLREVIALCCVTGIGIFAMYFFGYYWDSATGIVVVRR